MTKDKILQVRITNGELSDLDGLRRKETDKIPSQSEMVRRLIARASGKTVAAKVKKKRTNKARESRAGV